MRCNISLNSLKGLLPNVSKKFHDLPQELQSEAVRPYFEILNQRRTSLLCKSIFDRVMAAGMLITLSPIFLILAIMIKRDSEGEVFFVKLE